MCGRRHSWLNLLLFFVLLATASSVQAQAWLSDRKRAEGRGIRLGDFELHPGIGAEIGYYTNPFYHETTAGTGTAALRIAPHLFLSTLSGERREGDPNSSPPGWLALRAGVSGSFQHYFLYLARDAFNTDVNVDATIAPERPVSLRLTEVFRRNALPFGDTSLPADVGAVPDSQRDQLRASDYTNYYESVGAQLLFQTAGGLLKGSAGYRFGYNWFDDVGFKYNNNLTHSATFNLGWEFLPKTALFYDATYTHQTYTKLADGQLERTRLTNLSNNDQVVTRLGLNGAITSRIGATVAIGYAAGFYDTPPDPYGLIGNVEVRFVPSEIAELALAFDRAFLPSYLGNFQERNRIYARTRWLFVGALLIAARGGIEFLTFGHDEVQDPGTELRRDDRRYFADLSGEYRFIDWLALTAQFNLLIDDTAYEYKVRDPETMQVDYRDPAKFTALEFWLGVRAFL